MKTVIFVWTSNVNNIDTDISFWGIGDVIRGIISMYQLSQQFGFRLIVDIQLTAISELLKHEKHEYSDFVFNQRNNIPFIYPNNVMHFITTSDSDIVLLMTNDFYHSTITDECKTFIKTILTPTDEFETCILSDVSGIVHCRTGDSLLIHNGKLDDELYNRYVKKIDLSLGYLFMSDSQLLKHRIKCDFPATHMLNTTIRHSGYKHHSSVLRDTIMEFLTITRSKEIHSYTVYEWASGFVKIAHDIYDVPLKIYSL